MPQYFAVFDTKKTKQQFSQPIDLKLFSEIKKNANHF